MLYSSRLWAAVAIAGLTSCAPALEERNPPERGSFGEIVATLLCKRIAYHESLRAAADGQSSTVDVIGEQYDDACRLGLAAPAGAPPRLAAFLAMRPHLVDAIDATAPDDQLSPLHRLTTSDGFLASYDDGTTDTAVEALVTTMHLLADDPELAPALARLNHRLGYTPAEASLGLIARIARYPRLATLLGETAAALSEGGSLADEQRQLEAALSATLRSSDVTEAPHDPERTLALALDLLLTEDDTLGSGRPLPLVRRDARGLAAVAMTESAALVGFVDGDEDGRADADAEGRFVDAGGQILAAPTPFTLPDGSSAWPHRDELGRALSEVDGQPVYEYVDVDRTVLAAVVRDGLELVHPDRGVTLELAAGAAQLSGSRAEVSRSYADGSELTYRGYDTTSSPLLDLAHAYLSVLADPRADGALAVTARLLRDHEPVAARVTNAVIAAARKADLFPAAELAPDSALFDDLMPVLIEILETPGLAEELLRAMEQPEVAELGLRYADQMAYRDAVGLDPDTQQLTVSTLADPVDRALPDAGNNRSLWQRLLHLIHDSNGTVLCNKQDAVVRDPTTGLPMQTYDQCELLRIPNLAVFYLQSIAYAKDADGNVIYDDIDGTLTPRPKARFPFTFNNALIEAMATDDTLEQESTIEGFRHHPTPQALNRAMFLDPLPGFLADTMAPARCNQGDRYIDAHDDTLMVWELDGFYDQIRPIAQVFADHDAEQLLVDIISVLHDHWASPDSADHQSSDPQAPEYVAGSAAVRYESYLIELLRDRALLDAAVAAAPVIAGIEVDGRPAVDALADGARALFLPREGLSARDGSTSTVTADGRPVETLSAWHLIADANAAKREALAAAPAVEADWQAAVSRVIDVLLATELRDEQWRFVNPRVRGVSGALIAFVRGRLAAHDLADDRSQWLDTELPGRLGEVIGGPLYAAALDLLVGLGEDPVLRAEVDGLLAFLLDEAADPDGFATVVTAGADLLQLALDDRDLVPIARAVGEVLRTEHGVMPAQLELARAVAAVDDDGVLATLIGNAFTEHRPGHSAIGSITSTILEVNRVRPYDDLGLDYTADDYRNTFRAVAAFLEDEKRGLAKLIAIIRSRKR